MGKVKSPKLVIGALVMGAAVMVSATYWNEAGKEVVFLCRNFVKGTSQSSVITQLNTGNFLRYRSEKLSWGSRIVVDSLFNLSVYKCTIEFDPDSKVMDAHVE